MNELLASLKNELKTAVRRHLETLGRRFPEEEFYGCSLYTSDDVSSIVPVANSESAIKVAASDQTYNYYRFTPDEWRYWDDFGTFAEVNQIIERIHDDAQFSFQDVKEPMLRAAFQALRELEAEGVFGPRSPGRFVVLWLSDSANEIMRESAEQLNGSQAYKRFSGELSSPAPGREATPEFTPGELHRAALRGDNAEVRRLISNGADVNACDSSGWSPLFSAAVVGNAEAVRLLLASGADVNVHAPNGNTPLHHSSGIITRILLENGANVNAVSNDDWTALHSAAYFGRIETARILLDHGADPNVRNDAGKTPLEIAIDRGHGEVAGLLQVEDDEVIPNVGIGIGKSRMVRLGMPQDVAVQLLAGRRVIQVDFRGEPPVVAFIQSSKYWGGYDGIELFEMAADDVIAEIVRRKNLDPNVYAPGKNEYYFPDLNMILWRSCASSEDGDQGYVFDCVSLHVPGYYTPETIASMREQMGLPPVSPEDA